MRTGKLDTKYYVVMAKESLTPLVTIHHSSLYVLNGEFDSVNYFIVSIETYKHFTGLSGNEYN